MRWVNIKCVLKNTRSRGANTAVSMIVATTTLSVYVWTNSKPTKIHALFSSTLVYKVFIAGGGCAQKMLCAACKN